VAQRVPGTIVTGLRPVPLVGNSGNAVAMHTKIRGRFPSFDFAQEYVNFLREVSVH